MTAHFEQQSGCLLRLCGRGQDCALVLFKNLEPGRDVACMMIEMRDGQSQLSTKNGGGQLGDKFFDGIGITAEAVLEASIESRRMSSPVR